MVSAFASVVATLNNLGPGLGIIDNFTSMNPVAKWILIANVPLLVSIEVFTLLVYIYPDFVA